MNVVMTAPVAKTSLVSQTYGILALGLLCATVCAAFGLSATPSGWETVGLVLGAFALLYAIHKTRKTVWGLALFFVFTAMMGYLSGPAIEKSLEMPDGDLLVLQAIGTTTVVTVGLSLYAFFSGRNFNKWGGFLFTTLLIVLVASVAGIFLHSTMFDLIVSSVSALLFCGYILYDTSKLLRGEIETPVEAALSLFLNVMNLFFNILRILGIVRK